MSSPPDLPKVVCGEMNCWAWKTSNDDPAKKECLDCKHNMMREQGIIAKDNYMTKLQK